MLLLSLYCVYFLSSGMESISVAEIDDILHNDPAHQACQLEYRQLKDEFEQYKHKMQHSLKSSSSSKSDTTCELLSLKHKCEDLERELTDTRAYHDDKEKEHLELISNLQCELTEINEKHEKEIDNMRDETKAKLSVLEGQLQKQRERTFSLFAEKDSEIERWKSKFECSSPVETRTYDYGRYLNSEGGDLTAVDKGDGLHKSELVVNELLNTVPGVR